MSKPHTKTHRKRASEIDRHVGMMIRRRRVALGLSQKQLAELIDRRKATIHKYENGLIRISISILFDLACALNVNVDSFYEGLDDGPPKMTSHQRALLELGRSFAGIKRRDIQQSLCNLSRALNPNG